MQAIQLSEFLFFIMSVSITMVALAVSAVISYDSPGLIRIVLITICSIVVSLFLSCYYGYLTVSRDEKASLARDEPLVVASEWQRYGSKIATPNDNSVYAVVFTKDGRTETMAFVVAGKHDEHEDVATPDFRVSFDVPEGDAPHVEEYECTGGDSWCYAPNGSVIHYSTPFYDVHLPAMGGLERWR